MDKDCPCHNVANHTDIESVAAKALLQFSLAEHPEHKKEIADAFIEKLTSLSTDTVAEAVKKSEIQLLNGIFHKWMSGGELKTLEDIQARIKALTPSPDDTK